MPVESTTKNEKKKSNGFAYIAMIFSLIAIVISLLVYRDLKKDWQYTRENQIRLASASVQIGNSVSLFLGQVQAQDNKINSLSETLQHLSQMVAPVEGGILIQAEYLAQLAQLNLKYQNDAVSALSLLKMADQRLSTLALPPILGARQALAKNIVALETVPKVDLTGVVTQLNALSDQVEQLPLVPSLPRVQPTMKQPKSDSKLDTYLTDWKDALSTSWRALQRVVIIRHHGQPIEPLMTPNEYLYVKENVQLQIQTAQWAAIHQQQAMYVASLKQAASWVNHYFTDNNLISRAVQRSLGDLQKINVQPELPDISGSINAIQQAQKQILESTKVTQAS